MTFGSVHRDGIALRYEDVGAGPPAVFQHGLGGDASQVAEIFPTTPPMRRVTLECRAQGGSGAGPPESISIGTFADDTAFLADRLAFGPTIVGGLSMGAAIALRLAVKRPDLVRGLVLARPAWLFAPAPENMRPFTLIAGLLRESGPIAARAAFDRTELAQRAAHEAPDNLASLRRFFDRSEPATTAHLLSAIARDGPGISQAEARRIQVPTLVIGTAQDIVHPLAHAEELAATIPRAVMVEVTSKSVDRDKYVHEFKAALSTFMARIGHGGGADA